MKQLGPLSWKLVSSIEMTKQLNSLVSGETINLILMQGPETLPVTGSPSF